MPRNDDGDGRQCWAKSPQTVALLSAAFIFITAGMNLAFSLGWNYYGVTAHFRFSWCIGVMIGAIVAAPLIPFLEKRFYMMIASVLVAIGGIIFIASPEDVAAITAARYINGIGVGFATVAYIVHGSEIAAANNRAFCLGMEQLCVALGILVQILCATQWSSTTGSFSPNMLYGIICLCLGVVAFALAFVVIESPVFHIRRSNEAAALDCLTRLERPTMLTNDKKLLFEEHKNYVMANEYLGGSDSCIQGIGPLLKMLLYRSVLAFTFSLPYSYALILATTMAIDSNHYWTASVYAAMRILGALAACAMLDLIGRKVFGLISLIVMAALGTAIAIIMAYISNWVDVDQMKIVCVLLIIFQIFAGLYAPTTTVYMGEAFPLLWKPYFIALCLIVENMIHLIVICMFTIGLHSLYVFDTFTYVFLYVCFVLFIVLLPDTRETLLQEAQERFGRPLYLKLF